MFSVEITNFQSIKHVKFSFEGFSTVQGRNWIGKSATLRAINAALTNQQGLDFIRWGEKYCEVKIVTQGLDLTWHKEESNNFYVINGETYKKIGNQPPPKPIIDAGFGPLVVGDEKLNLFYVEQFEPLFLINRRDTKAADILISIYGLDRLYKASDLCAKDQKKNSDLLKIRKADLEIVETEIQRYDGLEEVTKSISDLTTKKNLNESEEKLLTQLKSTYQTLIGIATYIKKLKSVVTVTLPDSSSIESNQAVLDRLKVHNTSLCILKNIVVALLPIKKVALTDPPPNVDTLEKEIAQTRGFLTKLDRLNREIGVLRRTQIELPGIPEINIGEIDALKALRDKTTTVALDHKAQKKEYETLCVQYNSVVTDLSQFKECPLCGSKL